MVTMLRRDFLIGGLAGLPLGTVLARPDLARAAAAGLETVNLTTAGGKAVSAALATPDGASGPAPAILLIHEWWGLNDQIKAVAADLAQQGYLALAVDLYDGKVTDKPEAAKSYMNAVDAKEAADTLKSWIAWLRAHEDSDGKVGTVGWCFGGGWSLGASVGTRVEATVVYYGRVNHRKDELARLKGPVLGHYATDDQWINAEMVRGFEANMNSLGRPVESHWYEAKHAFANPTSARYDEADAKLAWDRTLAFFEANLKG